MILSELIWGFGCLIVGLHLLHTGHADGAYMFGVCASICLTRGSPDPPLPKIVDRLLRRNRP